MPVYHVKSTTTSAPVYDERTTVPVFKEFQIVEPVHGVSKPVYYHNSKEQQDYITTLSSVAETSLIHEIKRLNNVIKEKDNSLINLRKNLNCYVCDRTLRVTHFLYCFVLFRISACFA